MNIPLRALAPALLAVTLSAALTLPALAQIKMDTPAEKEAIQKRAAEARKSDAALQKALVGVKRLPESRRAGLASQISAQSKLGFTPKRGEGASLFTNMAATEQDACIAYFASRGSRFAQIGFDVFKDDFVAQQLEIVGIVFDGTKLADLVKESVGKLKSGMYDKAEMKKSLDLIAGAVMYGYEQKGGSVLYCASVGQAMSEGVVVGAMMSREGGEAQMRPLLTTVQKKVAALSAPAGFEPELSTPIQAFAKGSLADGKAAISAVSAVTEAFKAYYGKL